MKPNLRFVWLAMLLLATCPMHAQPAQKWITLYTDEFKGNYYEFGVGQYDHEYLALSGISMVHAVRVPAGMKVTLYSEDNFRGTALTLTRDASKAFLSEKGFTDLRLSISIVVEEARELPADAGIPTVVIYKDDFTGPALRLTTGRYDLEDLGAVGNDHISSLRIPDGMKVTLFEHKQFTGRSLSFTADVPASQLLKNNFNDAATSLIVEMLPPPPPAPSAEPVVAPAQPPVQQEPTTPVIGPTPTPTPAKPEAPPTGVLLFQGDFAGLSKNLTQPGVYTLDEIGIGNNELSSIKVLEGYRATLYDGENLAGRSLVLEETEANTEWLQLRNFNNTTSSIEVALIQRVVLFEDAFSGAYGRLGPGEYDMADLGIGNDRLSSARLPERWWVLLFEHEGFRGQSLLLTRDTDPTWLRNRGFDNQTSSVIVGDADTPLPQVIVYADDLSGTSQKLTPGAYEHPDLEMGNNAISSVSVPRGMRVTLFENSDFTGRALTTTRTVDSEFLTAQQFNNITSAVKVQLRQPEELFVTIFSDRFQGRSQPLEPGRYEARQLIIGQRALSSLRVPKGMRAVLYETDRFTGASVTVENDTDFSDKKTLDNRFSSIWVQDILEPEILNPLVRPAASDTVMETTTSAPPAAALPDCSLSEREYTLALEAVRGKAFSHEKMDMARLATKGKCLTNEQIAGFGKLFSFEDQTLEFVKESYPLAMEKTTYYTLQDLFNFLSTKEAFLRFLEEQ